MVERIKIERPSITLVTQSKGEDKEYKPCHPNTGMCDPRIICRPKTEGCFPTSPCPPNVCSPTR